MRNPSLEMESSATAKAVFWRIPLFAALALFSAFAFASRSIVTKAGSTHMSLSTLLLTQSLLSLPLLWALARQQGASLLPGNVPARLYGWRVLWGIATTALLFGSLQLMPAALASTLAYTTPLFLVLLAPLLLKEHSSWLAQGLVLVGFAGIGLNAFPYLGQVPLWQIGVGMLTGFCGALMQVYIRKLSAAGESGIRGVFWMHCASAAVAFCVCVWTGSWSISPLELLACLAIAVLSCVAQVCNASAYAHGRALPVNALSLLTLPLTVLMASIVLGEQVSDLAVLGMMVVLPACFALVWVEHAQLLKAHAGDHVLTRNELREEHAQVQTAFSPGAEPLYVSEPTDEELDEERQARCALAATHHEHDPFTAQV